MTEFHAPSSVSYTHLDQILTLEWKYLVPMGLANLLLRVVVVVFKLHF